MNRQPIETPRFVEVARLELAGFDNETDATGLFDAIAEFRTANRAYDVVFINESGDGWCRFVARRLETPKEVTARMAQSKARSTRLRKVFNVKRHEEWILSATEREMKHSQAAAV